MLSWYYIFYKKKKKVKEKFRTISAGAKQTSSGEVESLNFPRKIVAADENLEL